MLLSSDLARKSVPVDPRDMAPGIAVSQEDVLDVIVRKQFSQGGVDVGPIDARGARRPVPMRASLEHDWQWLQILGKGAPSVLRAALRVDEHRTRCADGCVIYVRTIGEEDPLILTDFEAAETDSAWTGSLRHFTHRWMAVLRGPHALPNFRPELLR